MHSLDDWRQTEVKSQQPTTTDDVMKMLTLVHTDIEELKLKMDKLESK